jgi:hypothetical protein
VVDILDAAGLLAAGRFDTGGTAGWVEGDTNYDGVVDILDVADFIGTSLFDAGNYLTPSAAATAPVAGQTLTPLDLAFAALAGQSPTPKTTLRFAR